jgi:hypothetical protein
MASRVSCFAERGGNIASTKAALMRAWTSQPEKPAAIIIHVGTNDIGRLSCLTLRDQIADLWTFMSCLSKGIKPTWSDMLPKAGLRQAGDVSDTDCMRIDRIRRDTNRFTRRLCTRAGGRFITHPSITLDNKHLYRDDGLHLSNAGCCRFMQDLVQVFDSVSLYTTPIRSLGWRRQFKTASLGGCSTENGLKLISLSTVG